MKNPNRVAAGIKASKANRAKDPDFYIKLGKLGGPHKHPNKGFGSMPREKVQEYSRKGGIAKRRKKREKV